MTHLKVAVRIRPLSQRETDLNSTVITEIEDKNTVAVTNLKVPEQNAGDSRERIRRFTFDYCFHPDSSQDEVFKVIDEEVRNAIKNRYHSCILAYGQSSSGKTHTMMGNPNDPGLTPKLCQNMFKYLENCLTEPEQITKTQTTVSYLEIYNEKVRDLLVSKEDEVSSRPNCLKVREHPKKGPYVQGLIQRAAHDPETLLRWLKTGNANRRVAATLTNPYSSRSHSVFTVTCLEGVQLHLVDLAGSERAGTRFHNISTLKEGANINRSLVALGNVISTLAEHSSKKHLRKKFVPYRDSVLTWLLKDTLGGNSKTVMIATVSPSSTCYNETVNTLRFGQRAKQIVSRPVVNEDPKERTIRELRAEIARLKQLLAQHQDPQLLLQGNTNLTEKPPLSYMNEKEDDTITEKVKSQKKLVDSSDSAVVPLIQNQTSKEFYMKREEFLPVMDVTSAIELPQKQVPKIRRTSSVEHTRNVKMDSKPARLFGSQDSISSPKDKIKKPAPHRKSLEKPIPNTKTSLLRQSHEPNVSKSEKGIVTEIKGPQKSEVQRRPLHKPRAEIVAAVTNRLYATSRRKEASTETQTKPPCEEIPKELTICSNARTRLQELTQKALKANRRKTAETQTDLFPVLRIKEISTDVDDLKTALGEVRDAETGMAKIQTKDAGVGCFIENFNRHQEYRNNFILTRSCGTQSTENVGLSSKPAPEQPPVQNASMSFTKYLQNNMEPTFQIVNPCTANPIFTSSVNINVNHNYINRTRLADMISDDSLEDDAHQNRCFPTPDIISNHNSLEHGNNASSQTRREEKHAMYDTTNENFMYGERFNEQQPPLVCVANLSTSPICNERLSSVDIPAVYAPEVCITKPLNREERCGPFWKTTAEKAVPTTSETETLGFAKTEEPIVLNSIIKHQNIEPNKTVFEHPALNLKSTDKEVGFSSEDNKRMMKAMSKFVEEATTLMSNLTLVASKLQAEHSYDVEVTVNDITGLPIGDGHEDVSSQTLEEAASQTSPRFSMDASANTEVPFQIPVNEYEALVKESCNRLEQCIMKSNKPNRRNLEEENLHKFPQPFSVDTAWSVAEDSSLDSNRTFSDYGSLPRQTYVRRRSPSCSPSAYLKQLTTMRKQIVESSRDDLIGEARVDF